MMSSVEYIKALVSLIAKVRSFFPVFSIASSPSPCTSNVSKKKHPVPVKRVNIKQIQEHQARRRISSKTSDLQIPLSGPGSDTDTNCVSVFVMDIMMTSSCPSPLSGLSTTPESTPTTTVSVTPRGNNSSGPPVLARITSKLSDAASLTNVELHKAPDAFIKVVFPPECCHLRKAEGIYKRMTPEQAGMLVGNPIFNIEQRPAELLERCGLAPSGDKFVTPGDSEENDVDPFGDDFRYYVQRKEDAVADEDVQEPHRTMPSECTGVNFVFSNYPRRENCVLRDPCAPVYILDPSEGNSSEGNSSSDGTESSVYSADDSKANVFFVFCRHYSATMQGSWCLWAVEAGDSPAMSVWAATRHTGHKSILDDSQWFVGTDVMHPHPAMAKVIHPSSLSPLREPVLPSSQSPLRFRCGVEHTSIGWHANIQISASMLDKEASMQREKIMEDSEQMELLVRDVQFSIAQRLQAEWKVGRFVLYFFLSPGFSFRRFLRVR